MIIIEVQNVHCTHSIDCEYNDSTTVQATKGIKIKIAISYWKQQENLHYTIRKEDDL
jgi:hypothetical protein